MELGIQPFLQALLILHGLYLEQLSSCVPKFKLYFGYKGSDGSQSFLLMAGSFQLLTFADNDYAAMWYLKLPLKNNKNPSLV